MDDLPLLVTPHPLNDLTPEQMRDLARAAYPTVLRQLTAPGPLEKHTRIDYVHPATAMRAPPDARAGKEGP